MTQTVHILTHLKEHDAITPLEALKRYGVMRLGARILELRESGHPIITDMIEVTSRRGTKRVASYRLVRANGG